MTENTQLLNLLTTTRNVVLGELTKAVCENKGYINLHNAPVGVLGFDSQSDQEILEQVKAYCLSAIPSDGSIQLKYIDEEDERIKSCSLDILSLNELYDIVNIIES